MKSIAFVRDVHTMEHCSQGRIQGKFNNSTIGRWLLPNPARDKEVNAAYLPSPLLLHTKAGLAAANNERIYFFNRYFRALFWHSKNDCELVCNVGQASFTQTSPRKSAMCHPLRPFSYLQLAEPQAPKYDNSGAKWGQKTGQREAVYWQLLAGSYWHIPSIRRR
jgi:hypothetical protein